jgi:hypothetical protein
MLDIYGESGGTAPPFLTSALQQSVWSASHPCHFTPGERVNYFLLLSLSRFKPQLSIHRDEPRESARKYLEGKQQENGEKHVIMTFVICSFNLSLQVMNQKDAIGRGMWRYEGGIQNV